jgi:hypothetical protein
MSGVKVMKAYQAIEKSVTNNIAEELHKIGYKETEGKTTRELSTKLAVLRVKVESPENRWF